MWRDALFSADGYTIFLPNPVEASAAQRLEQLSLARIESHKYLYCVNIADVDEDPSEIFNRHCDGRPHFNPAIVVNEEVQCPRCNRSIWIPAKRQFDAWHVFPNHDRLHAFVAEILANTGLTVREHPRGVFRVAARFGEVHVHLLDVLDDLGIAERAGFSEPAIFIQGAERWSHWRLPREVPRVRLAEIVLDSPTKLAELLLPMTGAAPPRPQRPSPPPATPSVAQTIEAKAAPRFVLPPGTMWKDIIIYYVDGVTIGVIIPGRPPIQCTANDLGMAKATNRNVKKRFKLLLHLCWQRGRTDVARSHFAEKESIDLGDFTAAAMQVTALGNDLKALFGLSENPFPGFGKGKDLVAAFVALPDRPGELGFGLDGRRGQSGHRAPGG